MSKTGETRVPDEKKPSSQPWEKPEIVQLGSVSELTSDYTGSEKSDGPRWTNKVKDKFIH
jgi:hypothetical protein